MDEPTVTVASTALSAVRIRAIDPAADPAKAGLVADTGDVIINGTGHPEAVGGLGITHDVPLSIFESWMLAHPHFASVLRAMTPEEFKRHAEPQASHGFEPGIDPTAKASADLATKDAPAEDDAKGHEPAKDAEHPLSDPAPHDPPHDPPAAA